MVPDTNPSVNGSLCDHLIAQLSFSAAYWHLLKACGHAYACHGSASDPRAQACPSQHACQCLPGAYLAILAATAEGPALPAVSGNIAKYDAIQLFISEDS